MLLPLIVLLPLVFSKSIPPRGPSCSFEKGDYSLSWHYDDLSSDVVFKLTARTSLPNFWTGVLLGEGKPTDAIGVFVRFGQIGLTDAFVSEDGIIVADNLTDVQSLSFDLTDDRLTSEFARPLTPRDKTDTDLGRCVTFFFPTVPVEVDMGEQIGVPKQMESRRICDIVESCSQRDQTALVKREETPTCEYKKDKQVVTWRHEEGRYVFTFDHPVRKGKWWSTIGAGESMTEMSMAVAFAEGGKIKNAAGYTGTGYQLPKKDDHNSHDVQQISSSAKNGKAHYEFSVNEGFIQEKLGPDGCVMLQVGVNVGPWTGDLQIKKHQNLPTAVQVCGIEQCVGEDKKTPAVPTEFVADVKPADSNSENPVISNQLNQDGEQAQAAVDAKPEGPKEAIVDARRDTPASVPAESVIDAQSIPSESVVDVRPLNRESGDAHTQQGRGAETADPALGQTVVGLAPKDATGGESQVVDARPSAVPVESVVDLHNTTSEAQPSGQQREGIVDVKAPETKNETIVDFHEAKPQEQGQVVDVQQGKREEPAEGQVANGTATVETEKVEENHSTPGKKTTKKPKKGVKPKGTKKPQEAAPAEHIIDFREDVEGSGDHFEGSGENATNETIVEERADPAGNSVLTELDSSNETEHSRPPIVHVDGMVEPKGAPLTSASTTFSPPVSVPKLDSEATTATSTQQTLPVAQNPPAASVQSSPPAVAATQPNNVTAAPSHPTTPSLTSLPVVPQVCENPNDLRICDGYFNDYISKVQEWSTKHNHTLNESMFKACRLLSQVKHVPSMCCNLYRKTCAEFSRPVSA